MAGEIIENVEDNVAAASRQVRFVPIEDVLRRYDTSKPTLWRRIKNGSFPKPVKHGSRALWVQDELERYDRELIAARDMQVAA